MRILHLSVALAISFGICGYHTLNKCQKEIIDSKCIVSGCYFGMLFYNNNKAQIDTYCASQIEPPKPSGILEPVESTKPKIDEINPKGKIR